MIFLWIEVKFRCGGDGIGNSAHIMSWEDVRRKGLRIATICELFSSKNTKKNDPNQRPSRGATGSAPEAAAAAQGGSECFVMMIHIVSEGFRRLLRRLRHFALP